MAKALKCDRCGAFYDYIKCLRRYHIHDMDGKTINKTIDLCPDCYEKFCDFLDGAWKSIGMKPKEVVGTGELYPGEFENSYYDEFEEEDGG